jgi:hypothetical protein
MEHPSTRLVSLSSKKWYRYRYAIVHLLLLTVAICGWTGLRVVRAWKQANEVLAIRTIEDCRVIYDGEFFFAEHHPESSVSGTRKWPEALLGKDLFHRAGTVRLPANRVDEALPHLKRLSYLRLVAVSKSDGKSREEVDLAVKRIGQAIPGLEDIMVEMNLNDEKALHSGGLNVQQSVDFLIDSNPLPALLLILRFYCW